MTESIQKMTLTNHQVGFESYENVHYHESKVYNSKVSSANSSHT